MGGQFYSSALFAIFATVGTTVGVLRLMSL
jgi:hypothetical protein